MCIIQTIKQMVSQNTIQVFDGVAGHSKSFYMGADGTLLKKNSTGNAIDLIYSVITQYFQIENFFFLSCHQILAKTHNMLLYNFFFENSV